MATFEDVQRTVRGHLPVLDGVRGLAILLVLVHNLAGPDVPATGAVLEIFDVVTNIGWIGVQLFFVLSGFLITGILLDTRGAPRAWSAFYMRRVMRIFPLYYATLIVAFAVVPLMIGRPIAASTHAVWYFVYLQNWSPDIVTGGRLAGNLVHLWSLAVEEQFYIFWPMVVLALRPRSFTAVALALVILAPLLRLLLLVSGASIEWAYQGTFARADALALGGLGALMVRDRALFVRWSPRLRALTWALGAALAALVVESHGFARQHPVVRTAGYSLLALFFVAFLLASVVGATERSPLARALEVAPLRILGKYSYGIYVFHVPIAAALRDALGVSFSGGSVLGGMALRTGFTALGMAASFGAAFVSFHLFEKRFLDLKRYFVARPEPA